MCKQNGFPWVNLWMLVFSIGGIWLIARTLLGVSSPYALSVAVRREEMTECYASLAVLLVIGLTALWRMPMPFSVEETEDTESGLTTSLRAYMEAWRTIVSRRWIAILFGAFALINILGVAVDRIAFLPLIRSQAAHGAGLAETVMRTGAFRDYLQGHLGLDIAASAFKAPARFFWPATPGGTLGTGILPPVVVLLLIPWLMGRLRRLREHPSLGRTARSALAVLPTIGILSALGAASWFVRWRDVAASAHGIPTADNFMLANAPTWLWSMVFCVTALPFLLGGVIGSLVRSTDGGHVDTDTFIRDGVRNLLPLMALVLMLSLAATLLTAPGMAISQFDNSKAPTWLDIYYPLQNLFASLVKVLLMFVPYAIVALGLNSLLGLKTGLSHWTSHAGEALRFVALGVSIIVPIRVAESAAHEMLGSYSLWSFLAGLIFNVVNVAMSAWITIAVWELYRCIGSRPPAVRAEE